MTTTSTYLIKALLDFASTKGVDTGDVCSTLAIDDVMIHDENGRVSIDVIDRLWSELSRRIDDSCLGLHFGESFGKRGEGHVLFTLMKHCRSMREAIESLIRYHGLMTNHIRPHLAVTGDTASIELGSNIPEIFLKRQMTEAVLSMLASIIKNISNNDFRLTGVQFAHAGPEDLLEYEKIFSLKPEFNCTDNRLIFHCTELDRAFPLAHREFHSYLRHYAETLENRISDTTSFIDRMTLFINRCILKGEDCSLREAAKKFEVSTRHLQNKLASEHTTYQNLLDDVRKSIALHLLKKKDILLIDIAFMLGYSDQSSFNRAFKRWTGQTPKVLKKQNVDGPY